MGREIRARFDAQFRASLDKGLWVHSYAGSNPNEFFAELTMWYFGSHGSVAGLTGRKLAPGAEGFKKYDPEAFALFDEFYSGKMEVPKLEPRSRHGAGGAGSRPRAPRDSLLARAIVARLTSYKVGETKLSDFLAHAGMSGPGDAGKEGWHVTLREPAGTAAEGVYKFHVEFRAPSGKNRGGNLADLEFKAGVLAALKWNND